MVKSVWTPRSRIVLWLSLWLPLEWNFGAVSCNAVPDFTASTTTLILTYKWPNCSGSILTSCGKPSQMSWGCFNRKGVQFHFNTHDFWIRYWQSRFPLAFVCVAYLVLTVWPCTIGVSLQEMAAHFDISFLNIKNLCNVYHSRTTMTFVNISRHWQVMWPVFGLWRCFMILYHS